MGGKAKSIKPLRKKKRKKEREKKAKEKRKAPKKGTIATIFFPTLVLQSSTMFFMIESLMFSHFHILVGIFIIELGLYIPTMGFLKFPRSS